MNIYPLSFSIDEHYLYKEDIFVRNLNWFQPVIIFKWEKKKSISLLLIKYSDLIIVCLILDEL